MKRRSYGRCAEYYDLVERDGPDRSDHLNRILHTILSEHGVHKVIDMTCGTGAQTIGLAGQGYQTTGVDSNAAMLKVARAKARGLGIRFRSGDICSARLGRCDAVISMFNSIGQLSRREFAQAAANVAGQLRSNGIYIFDIFNLEYMKAGNFRRYQQVEITHKIEDRIVTRIAHNRLDHRRGMIHVQQTIYIQDGYHKPVVIPEQWDLQIYSAAQLQEVLKRAGFMQVSFRNISGGKLSRQRSPSILAVAKMAVPRPHGAPQRARLGDRKAIPKHRDWLRLRRPSE